MDEYLPPILQKYGDRVHLTKYEIENNLDNYELLLKREAQAGKTDNEIPVVFVGNDVLDGKEIKKKFVGILKRALKSEELTSHIESKPKPTPTSKETIIVDKVDTTSKSIPESIAMASAETTITLKDTIYIAFFSEKGCTHCDRVHHDLKLLSKRPPAQINAAIVYKEFDIAEPRNKLMHEAFCQRNNVDEEHRLATPAVFIKGTGLIYGYNVGTNFYFKLTSTIKELGDKCKNTIVWKTITDEELKSAESRITARFSKFNAAPILIAGLLDGINPCAFGALIFFITFLTIAERKKKEILMVGLVYTVAVFITYYAVGAGFLSFLASLSIFKIIAHWVYILTGFLAVILGIVSIIDFIKARQGKLGEMSLQLPDKLKKKIHRVIISENEPRKTQRNFLVAAFSTGFFVSLLELACTGQVYLPTIIYVLGIPGLKTKAHLYLLLYNFMFIIPLIVVFFISYFGATSEQLNGFLKRNTAIIKILTALMFFGMAALLWRSILAG
ncbi:hypothetical protein J7L68_08225 [bacterium]|nr:hypothetical protein [bacterium]